MLSSLSNLERDKYETFITGFLKQWENPGLKDGTMPWKWGVHDDSKSIPTFGYGFNLQSASKSVVEKAITFALTGSTDGKLSTIQNQGLDIVLSWKAGDITAKELLTLAEKERATSDAERLMVKQLNALNLTDSEGGQLLRAFLFGEAGLFASLEYRLEKRLAALGSSLPDESKERGVLLSLFYNAETLIGASIADAINTDNHAKLWYEIRYNHANYALKGLQNRREAESNEIGILAPQDRLDQDEVLDAMDYLFTRDGSGAPYPIIAKRDAIINAADGAQQATQSFKAQIQPYLDVLSAAFANGGNIDFVQRGGNGDDIIKAGVAIHASLTADTTDDLIIDLQGSNMISSGGGNDYVVAGAGADTINTGDGNDSVTAGAGADIVNGGSGADILLGGLGNDEIDGGTGADIMNGGKGTDTYVVDNRLDKLSDPDLSTVVAKVGLNAAFDNVGTYRNAANSLTHNLALSSPIIDDVDGVDGVAAFTFIGNASDETWSLDFGDTTTMAIIRSGDGADIVSVSSSVHPNAYDRVAVSALIIQDFQGGLDHIDLTSFHAQSAETAEEIADGNFYWLFNNVGAGAGMFIYVGETDGSLTPAFTAITTTAAQLSDFIV